MAALSDFPLATEEETLALLLARETWRGLRGRARPLRSLRNVFSRDRFFVYLGRNRRT